MNDTIINKLREIEEKENVNILYAIESGSRAWGFASTDSDYDVRFIYIRKPEYYLKLEKTTDVIDWQLDDVFDINGWDLKKALVLLQKSNPMLFEWCNSPIVYKTTSMWEKISKAADKHFSPRASLYHYVGIAESTYREFLTDNSVILKKYFYALRPILACEWILKNKSIPPMEFMPLVENAFPQELRPVLKRLMDLKMNMSEKKTIPKVNELNCYIEERIITLKSAIIEFSIKSRIDWDELNSLFLEAIGL